MWGRIKNAVTGTKDTDDDTQFINANNAVLDDSPVIAELNKRQRQAVLDENKRVLVLAGAGSGKTKTLIQKIAYLIAEKQVSPKHILAITFTKNAANEMMDRLILMADEDGTYQQILSDKKLSIKERGKKRREFIKKYAWLNSITVKTFHGLCNQILRSRGGSEFDIKYKILMDNVFDADQSSRQIARETTEEIIHKRIILESQRNDASYLLSLKRYILNYYVDVHNLRLHEKQPDLYQKPYTTLGGERVRSKSERDIADWLYRHRIKYVYEPIIAPDTFEMQPDFFIPEANLFLEHVSRLSYSLDDKERVMEEAGENYFKIHESVMKDTTLFNKKMDELVLSRIDNDFSRLSPLEFTEEFRGNEKYLRYFILDVLKMIDKIKVHNKQFTTIYDKAMNDDHERIRDFYKLAKPLF
ncbi:MAG: UvrD-helicase domain-containing protein, partial [Candidatus Thermoplasmatota archaeon]|nr:UvrD-helicase domain-containing protein [Candidatus Thermoplasmatota archaeon]